MYAPSAVHFATCGWLTRGSLTDGAVCRPNAVCQDREGGVRDHGAAGTSQCPGTLRQPHQPGRPTGGRENVATMVIVTHRRLQYSAVLVSDVLRTTIDLATVIVIGGVDRGRHYTWPASSLPYQLQMAVRKVQVKKDAEKAARKARANRVPSA